MATEPIKAAERLWLTSDGERLVPEGDPDAATLYAAAGDEITPDDAKQFGVTQAGKLK